MVFVLKWYYLNLLSLVLGLVGWALPFAGVRRRAKRPMSRYVTGSLVCCLVVLHVQLAATWIYVDFGELVMLLELAQLRAEASGILVAVALLLNYVCSGVRRRREEGDN